MIQKGIQNEINFANTIDGKKLRELSLDMQELIRVLFKNVYEDGIIECWKSKYNEKADIKIKINNEIKGVSIKTGHECSMHQESTTKFYNFLLKIGVEKQTINYFDEFMKGIVNEKKVNSATFIAHNEAKINQIRKEFNNYYVKTNLIIRFIFQGTELQKYDCDAIIYGTPQKFLWATKDEILKLLVEYQVKVPNYINISALNIKNYDRNLRESKKKINKESQIQVKWYTLENDFKYMTKLREANKFKNL